MLHSHGLKTIVLAQAPATFQEQSPGWRWHQTFQRLGEWWEYQGRSQTSPDDPWLPDTSGWAVSDGLARGLFFLLVGGLVGWLGFRLVVLLRNRGLPGLASPGRNLSPRSPQPLGAAQWFAQARRHHQQGDYQAACHALYWAFLHSLAQPRPPRQSIPLDPSRTDGEYGELLSRSRYRKAGQVLLKTHERLCFSDDRATPEDYGACEQAYRQLTGDAQP